MDMHRRLVFGSTHGNAIPPADMQFQQPGGQCGKDPATLNRTYKEHYNVLIGMTRGYSPGQYIEPIKGKEN